MKSAEKSSRTMHSNQWTPCAPSSSRPFSTSSVIPNSSALAPPSPISSTHSDVELVLELFASLKPFEQWPAGLKRRPDQKTAERFFERVCGDRPQFLAVHTRQRRG